MSIIVLPRRFKNVWNKKCEINITISFICSLKNLVLKEKEKLKKSRQSILHFVFGAQGVEAGDGGHKLCAVLVVEVLLELLSYLSEIGQRFGARNVK